jgi:hypothetical protein
VFDPLRGELLRPKCQREEDHHQFVSRRDKDVDAAAKYLL